MSARALGLAAAIVAFGFGVGSASADPVPFFYLVPSGPTTVPTVVPVGTTTYQLWVDPSGVNTPGCTPLSPGLPTCVGTYGEDGNPVANGSLTMTAFSPIAGAPAFTTANLQPCPVTLLSVHYQNCSTVLLFVAGDAINGNSTPFELGTMTIANDGSGPGDVTLWTGDYVDANFKDLHGTGPQAPQTLQTLAIAAPEPGTLLLLGVGVSGLVAVRARRAHGLNPRDPARG